jgi:Endomembrane protein 70
LGESIVGDRRETSPYEISFGDSVDWRLLCKTTLEKGALEKFKKAIQNSYFFEMFVEDLPMWGYIGDNADEDSLLSEVEGTGKTYLFPHLHFYLGHNAGRIVSAKVTTDVRILWISGLHCGLPLYDLISLLSNIHRWIVA